MGSRTLGILWTLPCVETSLSRGARASGNRHCGDANDDADKSGPGGRCQRFSEEYDADRYSDRHAQIGLRSGAHRSQCLHEPKIDDESKRSREYREAEQCKHRLPRRNEHPGPVHGQADGHEDCGPADERASRRHDRIEWLEPSPKDCRARVADRSGYDRELNPQLSPETLQGLYADNKAGAGDAGDDPERLAARHRFMARERRGRKAKMGDVELRMVAKPASTVRSAQAISVNGTTLFRQA